MVYKLGTMAEEGWRRLKGLKMFSKIVAGVKFKNGEEVLKEQVA